MMMRSWIRRLFTHPVARTIGPVPHRSRPALEVLEDRCVPSTIVVNNPTDTNVAGQTDLRQAIAQANAAGGAQTITFDSSVFGTPRTITLGGSQLELSDRSGTETITGPAAGVTVSGGGNSRVFQVDGGVTASISGLTITGGSASGNAGVNNYGTLALTNCTVSGNYFGLIVQQRGTAALTNCTVSGNGTGLFHHAGGRVALTNCTVSGNGTGINGSAALTNCIVAANTSLDVLGVIASGGHNLIGQIGNISGWVSSDLTGTSARPLNPDLAPLGNYGGPTQTMALLPGSPAINAGSSGAGIPTTDQRGLGRVGAIDVGAFESQGFTFAQVPGNSPQTSDIGTAFANPLAVTVAANNPIEPVNGGVVRFVANPAANGAAAIFMDPSAVIDNNGQAAVIAAPNNVLGSYTVVAATPGSPISFALTNAGQVFAPLVVNTTSDSIAPGAGLLSLREAIAFANTDPSATSTITFDPAVFASAQTIALSGAQLELSHAGGAVTITGPAAGVTVNAGGLSRVFQVDGGVTASISGLTISGGNAYVGGGVYNGGSLALTNCTVSGNSASSTNVTVNIGGGGVYNGGSLALTNCTVSGNSARRGGGVNNIGTATLTNCTVSGNSAVIGGGGVNNIGTSTLTNCTVSGNSASLYGGGLNNYGTATLTNCTVSGNSSISPHPFDGRGGGVDNRGTATLTNCTVSGNSASALGGGVNNFSTATLTNCTVSGNSASVRGGGLYNAFGDTATLTNCTVSGNSASFGGGLDNYGPATLTNCTVSGNSASVRGGGVNNATFDGTATLTNCTVSGNSANVGGGLYNNGGTATLTNCTVSGNSATVGGGVFIMSLSTATLTNTIVAGQTAGGDISGTVVGSNNLIGTGGSGGLVNGVNGNIVGVANPLLAPLGNYGGPTQTMPPLPGSPAIDAGTSGAGIPATDQRGLGRVGQVDIGAVERQAPTITVPAAQTAFEDVDQSISGIGVGGDPQGQTPFTVTLSVGQGTLTLATTSGLTVTGNGSGLVSLSGSIDDINAALAGLVYRGTLNYSGPDTLNLTASDGNRSTQAGVSITVKSAAAQAADLQTQVSALQSAGVLNQGQANSLIVKLNLKGNNGDIGKVQAFLNEVAADLKAGILTQAQADALLGPGNILLLSVTRR